jgi:hypothetical protein
MECFQIAGCVPQRAVCGTHQRHSHTDTPTLCTTVARYDCQRQPEWCHWQWDPMQTRLLREPDTVVLVRTPPTLHTGKLWGALETTYVSVVRLLSVDGRVPDSWLLEMSISLPVQIERPTRIQAQNSNEHRNHDTRSASLAIHSHSPKRSQLTHGHGHAACQSVVIQGQRSAPRMNNQQHQLTRAAAHGNGLLYLERERRTVTRPKAKSTGTGILREGASVQCK